MFCSNCGAEAKGNFCSKCGAKIEEPQESAQYSKTQTNDSIERKTGIIIRSENCTDLLEERKKANDRGMSQILGSISVGALLFLASPAIYALLEDKKLSQVDSLPLPVTLITMGIVVVICFLMSKAGKEFNKVYMKYKGYCSTEVLIVEETKIYGSTSKGALTLTFNQIESVRYSSNSYSPENKNPVISNDIFIVRDVVGNEFTFYSFKNCKDLKAVIDAKLKRN